MARELIGDQGAGDAATQYGDIATQVLLQRRECMHQSIAHRPPRIATFQIHATPACGETLYLATMRVSNT